MNGGHVLASGDDEHGVVSGGDARHEARGPAETGDTTGRTAAAHAAVTIVIADDHAAARAGVRMLLGVEPGFDVVDEAADLATAIRSVQRHRPRVLVLDLNMPESSLGALPSIIALSPHTGVVMLTMENNPAFAREALRAGALSYVLKDAADDELVNAVRRAADGIGT